MIKTIECDACKDKNGNPTGLKNELERCPQCKGHGKLVVIDVPTYRLVSEVKDKARAISIFVGEIQPLLDMVEVMNDLALEIRDSIDSVREVDWTPEK